MRSLRRALIRIRNLVGKTRTDRDLSDELDVHLQMHIDDNLRAGMTPEDARRQALLALGGVDQAKEQYRDRRSIPFIETTIQDLRHAIRAFLKSPAFTAAAIVTLALGIGVNTAMFSFADATAFRPPDVPRPSQLVRIFSSSKDMPYDRHSYPDYLDLRDQNTTLTGLAAYDNSAFSLSRSSAEAPQIVGAWAVSANIFSVLEVAPALGRGFRDDEGVLGADAVVVISHRLWERLFASDPSVIGRQVTLGRRESTIIGVMPKTFAGTELFFHPDLYVPITMMREVDSSIPANLLENRATRWLTVLGRPRPGVTAGATNAEIATLARALEARYADTNRGRSAIVLPEVTARGRLEGSGYDITAMSLGLVGLVLLIACANVANLTLSRATGRTREIAVRLALGASRGRVVRQLLTESLLLASSGGALGLLVAYGGVRYLSMMLAASFATSDLPVYLDARIDARVLLFTLATAMLTGVLFGLTPALRSTRVDLVSALKASLTGSGTRRQWFTLRNLLVGSQIALAVVVLSVAGLAIQGFIDKQERSPGFRTDHVLLTTFDPSVVQFTPQQAQQFYQQIVERTRALPGVSAAGLVQNIPLAVNGMGGISFFVDGYQMPEGQERLMILSNTVDAGSWNVLRTRIVAGRAFDERDTASSQRVVIVNETMARRYWPNQNAIGQVVRVPDRNGPAMQVVGVAEDGKYLWLTEPQRPFLFLPFSQREPSSGRMTLAVLGEGDAASLAAPIRAEVHALGPGIPVYDVRTLDNLYQARALVQSRLLSQIMTALGLLGMVLAVVGLYGVISYLTALRTREIGIRMAIGADRRSVLLLITKQAIGMVGAGLAVGVGISLFLTPVLAVPFGLRPRDGTVMAIVPLALAAAALMASLIPASRATRVSPMVALRDE